LHQPSGLSQVVKELDHGDLVRHGDVAAAKPHRPGAAHRVAEPIRRDFQRQVPPVEPCRGERTLHHELRRVSGHRLTKEERDFLKRGMHA
jgi:hypothetical protein